MTPPPLFHVIVLELDDVVARIRPDRPNLYVGISTHTPEVLAAGLTDGRFRPVWARGHVTGILHDVAPDAPLPRDHADTAARDLIRQLRTKGFTVNRNTTAYRTYVINLHDPSRTDVGAGYVYVGQTSKPPEERLCEHLTEAVSAKGVQLSSRSCDGSAST